MMMGTQINKNKSNKCSKIPKPQKSDDALSSRYHTSHTTIRQYECPNKSLSDQEINKYILTIVSRRVRLINDVQNNTTL
jgi:hypothetical protein